MILEKLKFTLNSEKGFAALIALIMVGMLTLIGLAAMSTSDDEVTITGNAMQDSRAFYAAESGLAMAVAQLESEYDSTNAPPLVLPNMKDRKINNCLVSFETIDNGPATTEKVTSGSLAGLNAFIKSFSVTSTSVNQTDFAKATVSQTFETVMVPIFQWAVFFDDELWAQPAFNLSVDGRVHVNGDMHLQAVKTMSFLDKVTCGGDIIHGFGGGLGASGDVQFTDQSGNLVSMKQGSNWIDANDKNWYDTSLSLWQGNVQDQAYGQEKLNLPISNGADPHKVIERSTGNPDSMQKKATFQIIDGVPLAKIGSVWQDVSADLPVGTITSDGTKDFYDGHESKTVQNTQVDISLLKDSKYFPSNGIVYISDQGSTSSSTLNGTSLINGAELGNPLTIVSENPLYIEGDYNTINKQPASTISDAVTFLSNNWDPAKSKDSYSNRKASKTEVNLSIITGDIKPTSSNYGGGLENLPRFLEDWNSTEFKVRGSMVQMWQSQQANGTWRYTNDKNPYYSAPTRNWGFDTDLNDMNKLPPGTPMVRIFLNKGWQHEDVGYANTKENALY